MLQPDRISTGNSRESVYEQLLPQIAALVEGETDPIANMANVSALIKESLGFHWVGFYLVKGPELVLGPFQGPVACTRIQHGKGVCGTSWSEARTIVVEDVEKFPGHIACSALSRSEVVVPMKNAQGEVIGVLDVDSAKIADLTEVDRRNMEQIIELLMNTIA